MLCLIHRSQPHHAYIGRIQGRGNGREYPFKAWQTQRIGHRRAVQMSAQAAGQHVHIGMRVQPKHKLRPSSVRRRLRDPSQCAGRHRVITADKNWKTVLCGQLGCLGLNITRPSHNFGQFFQMRGAGHLWHMGWKGEITQVRQAKSQAGDDLSKSGCPKGIWPHKATATACARLKGQA